MTFSFTLVLGLFLLAPGLAAFAGLYHGSKLGRVEAPPPPPASILALSVVTVGAMATHLAGALIYWLQDLWCAYLPHFDLGYETNVYAALFNLALDKTPVRGVQVLAILLTLVVLTGWAFFSTRWVVSRIIGEAGLKAMLYGWLAEVDVATEPGEAVLAYVVSDTQEDGTIVGYEGVVANMTTNAEKEITSVLLDSCEVFYLRVTTRGVTRRRADRDSSIGQLYLDRSHIKNVAFELVKFEDSEESEAVAPIAAAASSAV